MILGGVHEHAGQVFDEEETPDLVLTGRVVVRGVAISHISKVRTLQQSSKSKTPAGAAIEQARQDIQVTLFVGLIVGVVIRGVYTRGNRQDGTKRRSKVNIIMKNEGPNISVHDSLGHRVADHTVLLLVNK